MLRIVIMHRVRVRVRAMVMFRMLIMHRDEADVHGYLQLYMYNRPILAARLQVSCTPQFPINGRTLT